MSELQIYFSSVNALQAVGVVGFLVYIFAFASVQLSWMDGNGVSYTLWNLAAASLVGLSLFAEFNLSSALIQTSWVLIGLVGLIQRFARRRAAQTQSRTHFPAQGAS